MSINLQKIDSGNTAEIFQLDNRRILKLFKAGYSYETVLHEYQNYRIVRKALDNVPNLYDLVEEDGRFGYIMEYIKGTNLTSLLQKEQTSEEALDVFVHSHKAWLKETSDEVISYKEWMITLLDSKQNELELIEKIRQLPEGNTLCHGDFHPYNILVTAGNKPIVIDFANICKGPREYDIARTYFLLKEAGVKPMAELYLEKMQVELKDIQEYHEVLEQLRKYELE